MTLKRNYVPAFPAETTEQQLIKAFYQNSTFSVLINKRISMQDHAIQCRTISRNSLRGHVGGGRSVEALIEQSAIQQSHLY